MGGLRAITTVLFLATLTQLHALDLDIDNVAMTVSLKDGLEDPTPSPQFHEEEPPSKADLLYEKALKIRSSESISRSDSKKAVELLYAAAGISKVSVQRQSSEDTGYITANDVHIEWRNGTFEHKPSVRELIYVFREGNGAPFNPAIAHRLLEVLADSGDPDAQSEVGFHIAQGIIPVSNHPEGNVWVLEKNPDTIAALVLYTFASKGGDPIAQMTMGYRHFYGLGVPKSCHTAALYYLPVAERALKIAKYPEALPQIKNLRLSYSSISSARTKPTVEQEFLHYQWFADYGHAEAARAVAHLLAHGEVRDFGQAVRYLQQAADAGDADAMAHLGHMYANGHAVKQDNATAWKWFWKSAERGHASGFFGLAYAHLTGRGADVDHRQSFNYFRQAVEAGQDWPGLGDALFFLATMHLKGQGTVADTAQAATLFKIAASQGHLLASYNLAVLYLRGLAGEAKGSPAACKEAVLQLKKMSERQWPTLAEAYEDFQDGDYSWALLNYLKAAEWGSELAQSNAAWMLSEGYGVSSLDFDVAASAIVALLTQAAEQGNTAALVRLGDAYWYGRGVEKNWARAAKVYGEAAKHKVAQALFNLGFMHQHGAGVPKDPHLAKRYYDRSAEAASDAKFASRVALLGLRLQRWWEAVVEGKGWLPIPWAQHIDTLMLRWLGIGSRTQADSKDDDTWVDSRPTMVDRSPSISDGVKKQQRQQVKVGGILQKVRQMSNVLDAIDESTDLTMLMWLAGVLALVLWRRQALRARTQHQVAVAREQPEETRQRQPSPTEDVHAHIE